MAGVLAAAWMFTVADRLPAELASHWNGRNEVDGYSSLWGMAAMTVAVAAGTGSVVSLLAVATRSQNLLIARIGVGFGAAFGVGLTSLMLALVAGQLDLADASQAGLSAPVMAWGLALAFVVGAGVIWLYQPGEIERTENSNVVAMNKAATSDGTALYKAGQARAARGETMTVKVSMGSTRLLVSLGVGAVTAASVFFIFPLLALLGVVVGALVWVFCQGTVVIGPDGVKVLASGFWKVKPLNWKEIGGATVEDIKALDYGGWGYRMNGGSVGFIMASGPALVMECGFHQKSVVSMPTAATAGEAVALVNAYVNAYVNAATVKN